MRMPRNDPAPGRFVNERRELVDVVVVGGGISGLCAAYWLAKQGFGVKVLEREADVGGTMKSVHEQGFLSETGPNSALETTPLFRELVAECGISDEFLYANPVGKNRYILRDGRMHALPLSPAAFLTTKLFSARGKFRLLKEPFVGRGTGEESIAEFVSRRVGQEFLDYAIDPFVAGVFAGRPESLSIQASFPKLYALEKKYGGLVRGMIGGRRERKQRAEKAKDRAESFSFAGGMQVLPRAIATKLGHAVLTNARVEAIRRTDPYSFSITYTHGDVAGTIDCRSVIVSSPAYGTADLVQPLSGEAASALRSITYSPVTSMFLGFKKEEVGHPLDGFGVLIPTKERRNILGCLWSSSLFPHRAPEGMVALTAFVGGARRPELTQLPENKLCDLVLNELKKIMQVSGKLVYLKVTTWKQAIPQYELGYLRKIEALDRFEESHPGLFLCGNYRGGISVGDCVKSASEVSQRAAQHLRTHASPA